MIVVPGSFQAFSRNINLLNRIIEIQRLDANMKIGMFFPQYAAMEDLQKLFEWCKSNLMAYVFAATYAQPKTIEAPSGDGFLKIFSFLPFGTFDVKDVTNSDTYEELFPGLNFNFNKHIFRVTPYPTIWEKQLWLDVFSLMNATGFETANEHDITTWVELAEEGSKIRVYPVSYISYRIFVQEAQPTICRISSLYSGHGVGLVFRVFFRCNCNDHSSQLQAGTHLSFGSVSNLKWY